jgi:hypothetical protein
VWYKTAVPRTSRSSDACIDKVLPEQICFVDGAVVIAGDFLLYLFSNGQVTMVPGDTSHERLTIGQMYIIFWMLHPQLFR